MYTTRHSFFSRIFVVFGFVGMNTVNTATSADVRLLFYPVAIAVQSLNNNNRYMNDAFYSILSINIPALLVFCPLFSLSCLLLITLLISFTFLSCSLNRLSLADSHISLFLLIRTKSFALSRSFFALVSSLVLARLSLSLSSHYFTQHPLPLSYLPLSLSVFCPS